MISKYICQKTQLNEEKSLSGELVKHTGKAVKAAANLAVKTGYKGTVASTKLAGKGVRKLNQVVKDYLYERKQNNLVKQHSRQEKCNNNPNELSKYYCLKSHYNTAIEETVDELKLARKDNNQSEISQAIDKIQKFKNTRIKIDEIINDLENDERDVQGIYNGVGTSRKDIGIDLNKFKW